MLPSRAINKAPVRSSDLTGALAFRTLWIFCQIRNAKSCPSASGHNFERQNGLCRRCSKNKPAIQRSDCRFGRKNRLFITNQTRNCDPAPAATISNDRMAFAIGKTKSQPNEMVAILKRGAVFPACLASFSIMPTIVSPKHCVMTVPPSGMSGTRYLAISFTLL